MPPDSSPPNSRAPAQPRFCFAGLCHRYAKTRQRLLSRTRDARVPMPDKKRVLILCTGNSARSQMAEGLLRHDAGERFDVESAGTKPSIVRPEAVAAMKELGIDISGHRSKSVDEFDGQHFDYVITVCDSARESCPVFFGPAHLQHRTFDDPAALNGSEEERLALFRRVRDELRVYLSEFAQEQGGQESSARKRPVKDGAFNA